MNDIFLNANAVTVKLVNAKGKQGQVNTLLKNFLQYVMTNEPVDDFTEDVARQIVAVKNDPIARRDYMVLATRIKDARRAGYVEGEAKGLAQGLAEGEAKKSRETAIKMLKKHKPLSEIKEFTDMSEEEIVRLAKENGLEVING
ncbi:MAG: hypothetical protein MSQ83_03635 [Phascolarctobacterium sp.]|nr:hypothetical protein [Phascolarctobacterium sp.]